MVFADPVFHWSGLFPKVHGESPRQSRGGRTKVVYVTRPTILVGATKFVYYVGAIGRLCRDGIVCHDQLACLFTLIVNVELYTVTVVVTFHIFLQDVFDDFFISFVLGVHVVFVVDVMYFALLCLCCLCLLLFFQLFVYFLVNLRVSVAIIHE